ncbi:hypothetical protein SCP_0311930 [Sparassis crispa]|uniref:Uncharacterized protein n=1 Tax=Sparassis crispa TaxID=139825 RepID=A0A401GGY8_9APHY|nr:hypothetical protein SCP_0311930 [Sparassis crispa]GBE81464.1 hypothetical protein SCP_0311930 [Sparassis crispa]
MFPGNNCRCFLRIVHGSLTTDEQTRLETPYSPRLWEIHDVRSFVCIMAADGRPAPSENAVRKLEELLCHAPTCGSQLHLMDHDAFNKPMRSNGI